MKEGLVYLSKIRIYSILTLVFVFILLISLYNHYLVNTGFFIFSIFTVSYYFFIVIYFTKKDFNVNNSDFERKLFGVTFVSNIIHLFFQTVYFYSVTKSFFSPDASDEFGYHFDGLELAKNFWIGNFDLTGILPSWGLSDLGYPVFVGIVYSIFPSMIFLKIVQAMLLGFIGILTFRITINVSNRETAKLAAILVAFFPIFHWFTGNTLKEIVMTFLILISIEKIILILNGKLNLKGAILLGLVLVSLFTFRSAIAVILTVTLVGSIIFTRKGGIKTLILGLILMLTIFLSILSLGEGDAIIRMVQDRSTAFEASQQQFLSRGQSIANILSVPLSIASVAIAPLPSYVEIPVEYNEYNIHGKWYFSGGLFLKNCLAFFSIIGMFFLVKKRLKSSFPLFIFTFSYWYVLALAGLFTSTRYQLPTIPFTLIFAAIALTNLPKKSLQYYLLYLILLVPVIIFWNYIQIQGRGIIN